jgi:putative peptidoglycan lipid II flippase
LLTRIPRLVIAAAGMAATLYFAIDWFAFELSSAAPLVTRAATLVGLVSAAMVVYFALAFGLGGASLGMIRRSVKRKTAAPAEAVAASEASD